MGIIGRAYSNAPLFRKLLFSVILIVSMGVAVSVMAIYETKESTNLLTKFYHDDVKMVLSMEELDRLYTDFHLLVLTHLAAEDFSEMRELKNKLKISQEQINNVLVKSSLSSKGDAANIDALKALTDAYFVEVERILEESENFEKEKAFRIRLVADKRLHEITAKTKEMVQAKSSSMERAHTNSLALLHKNIALALILVTGTFVLSVFIAYFLARNISHTMAVVVEWAKNLGAGILTNRVIIESKDEFGSLATSLNIMAVHLEHWQQDLSSEVEKRTAELACANEALLESRSTIKQILDTAPQSIFWKDLDGVYQGCNRNFANAIGLKDSEQIKGRTDLDLPWSKEETDAYLADDREVTLTNRPKKHIIAPMLQADGSRRWVDTTKVPLLDRSGKVIGVLGTFEDITDRKLAEDAAKSNDLRMRRLLNILQHPSETIQDFLDYALGQVIELTESKIGYIYHYHEDRKEFILNSWSKEVMAGCSIAEKQTCYELNKTGIWGEAVRQRRPIIVNDFQTVHPFKKGYPEGHCHLFKFMTVPIFDGECITGVVGLANKETDYTESDILQVSLLMETVWKVTDRMSATHELLKSETSLKEAQHIAKIGNWDFELISKTLTWSDEVYRIFEIDNEQFGASYDIFIEVVHPEDREFVNRAYTESLNRKTPYDIVHRLLMRDGRVKYVQEKCETFYASDGQPLRSVGTVQDITDRKLEEIARLESEERLVIAQDAAKAGVWDWDIVSGHLEWSPQMFEIFGLDHQKHAASFDTWKNCLYPDDLEMASLRIEQALKLQKPLNSEYRIILPGDKVHWINAVGRASYDANGQPIRMTGICFDITERKRLEEEQDSLQKQLNQAQKMESIGILAGGIAHDFNNILGVILGYTEIAIEDVPPDSGLAQDLNKVLTSAYRAKDLVKQILAFSRQSTVDRIPLKIQPLVKESLKMMRASLPSTITINDDIQSQDGVILADPTQVHQIVMNLCTNAFHAMEKTGGVLSVAVHATSIGIDSPILFDGQQLPLGQYVELVVRDTGTGIGPDIMDKIFDPFFTTKEVGRGTGMGLSITHGIIKSYGGAITVESTLGEGTTFHLYFPVVQAEAKELSGPKEVPMGKERILFVDDEELLMDMGRSMFERLGYAVTACTRSIEAFELFKNDPGKFDLVITDQTMPGMTGTDLARRMLLIRPDLPIILCTGYSNLISEASAKVIGIREFALKPLTKSSIGQLVRKVLDGVPVN